MNHEEKRIWLIRYLIFENERYKNVEIPNDEEGQKRLLRSLFNLRMPSAASEEFLRVQDEYLQEATALKGIADVTSLAPVEDGIYLWQGDITTLKCGAVVNAANSAMLGCFYPCHGCIDNAIHTYAGVQLRKECDELMQAQGHEEPTGQAKITKAYNLPCNYVIHTVGPIVYGRLTQNHCNLLEACYKNCLTVAENNDVGTIAFCCVSTGEFRFPNDKAAEIAVKTVREFRSAGGNTKVVFNVFKDCDLQIYKALLGDKNH